MKIFYESDNENLRLTDIPTKGSLYAARLNEDWLRVKIIMVEEGEVWRISWNYTHNEYRVTTFQEISWNQEISDRVKELHKKISVSRYN